MGAAWLGTVGLSGPCPDARKEGKAQKYREHLASPQIKVGRCEKGQGPLGPYTGSDS